MWLECVALDNDYGRKLISTNEQIMKFGVVLPKWCYFTELLREYRFIKMIPC